MASIKNLLSNAFSVGGVTWAPGESKTLTISQINKAIVDVVEAGGKLSSDVDLTPLYGLSDLANTQNAIVNTTGTAATPASGTRTLAAISDTATAANAIAGIAAELNLIRTTINAAIARSEVIENAVIDNTARIDAIQNRLGLS